MLLNLCLLATTMYLIGLTYHSWPVRRQLGWEVVRLAVVAVACSLMVMNGVDFGAFHFDLRYVLVALVAIRYGMGAGLLVVLPAVILRFADSTQGGTVAVANSVSVVVLAQLIRPYFQFVNTGWRDLRLLPVPFLGLGLAMLAFPGGSDTYWFSALPMLALNTLGALLAVGVLRSRLHMLQTSHRLRVEAQTDSLTGLGNRRRFDMELLHLPVGASLALLDVDHFRQLNDQFGSGEGDRALRHIGQVLREAAPEHAYRISGQEFALVLSGPDVTVRVLVEDLLARVAVPTTLPWAQLTLSAGLAEWHAGESPADLLHRADEALYLAKVNGRARLVTAPARDPSAVSSPDQGAPAHEVRPRHSLWQAQRATVELLTQRRALTEEDWQGLLERAVRSVDGAEAGSLTVREGRDFRLSAQYGFEHQLVGTVFPEQDIMDWYGPNLDAWRQGVPRVLRGPAVFDTFVRANPDLLVNDPGSFRTIGRSEDIRSTLCVPVMLHGEVVAHLNLDSFSSEVAFTPQVAEEAKTFVQQLAALLQLQDRWRELDLLGQLHGELDADDEEVEARLTAVAVKLLRSSHAMLLRYDAAGDALEATVMQGRHLSIPHFSLPRGRGPNWRALTSGQVVRVANLLTEPDVRLPTGLGSGDAAMLALPLLSRTREPLGVLTLTRSVHRPYQDSDEHLASILSSVGARILERQSHVMDLRATLEASLTTLGVALEARDFETQGHTQRVTDLAALMGAGLALPDERLTALRHGAALHDIGKLCIPDAVLLKPGRLTPEEFQVIQQHSPVGAELAARMPHLHPEAHSVIRHHHERWDGAGYPDRLAGDDIPLLARIFALCDVYDALTSERPYKKAMDHTQAMDIILEGRGTQFDPRLTELFATLIGDHAQDSRSAPPLDVSAGFVRRGTA
ncbi:HD domain-containing phosphohydrolase [Deinococcus sp.]|uniref:HD domain-containing phosphohydrolase n=1 Tax=Deinococcus sp. TaxID=47478 RepID=UPI0028698D6E|nr:HD domain-containing phosphohydrolase [Deinococcus sp.]